MRMFTTVVGLIAVIALARSSFAQDMPLGVWTGFAVRVTGNNQNRQPVRLEIKKIPDPYVAWRGGSGELVSAIFQLGNQNNQVELSTLTLADNRLTIAFTNPDQQETTSCSLMREPKEGTYVGDCLSRRITLTPPAPAPATPADARPAEGK